MFFLRCKNWGLNIETMRRNNFSQRLIVHRPFPLKAWFSTLEWQELPSVAEVPYSRGSGAEKNHCFFYNCSLKIAWRTNYDVKVKNNGAMVQLDWTNSHMDHSCLVPACGNLYHHKKRTYYGLSLNSLCFPWNQDHLWQYDDVADHSSSLV